MTELKLTDFNLRLKERILFEDVNLTLKFNRLQILGSNGTGKSSFLNAMYNGEFEGRIEINGNQLSDKYNIGKLISYVPQFPHFFEDSSLEFNIKCLGYNCKQCTSFLTEYIDDLNTSQKMREFSGGQRQIINLMFGLFKHSSLLILDEPFNHLSKSNREKIEKLIDEDKRPIIIVAHNWYLPDCEYLKVHKRGFVDAKVNSDHRC